MDRSRRRPLCISIIIVGCLLAGSGLAQAAKTRHPLTIPMRDGAALAADLWSADVTRPLPVVLIQTPYNKDVTAQRFVGAEDPGPLFASDDYAFVVVDWRGRHGSRAARGRPVGADGADGYDTVEWIAAQPWCNGRVGTWGPSALGIAQYRTAETHPPHLVCGVPMVAAAYYRYETFYPGGVLREEYAQMLDVLGFDMTRFITAHPTEDLFWKAAARRWDPAAVGVPLLLIGGWYDLHAEEVPADFAALRSRGAQNARDAHRLLMGPWTHTAVGEAVQGELSYPAARNVAGQEALAFYDRWLRGLEMGNRPAVRYFQMGEDAWHEATTWPPAPTMDLVLYLRENGSLTTQPPGPPGDADEYTYDPADPTPTVGGAILDARRLIPGPLDQRAKVESRKDVLVYTTGPLNEEVAIVGNPMAQLYVSSDRPDTDFAVRLCDVYPDGRSMLVTDGIVRASLRDSTSRPQWLTPEEVYLVTVKMPPTAMTFLRGHSIRIIISSANAPRFRVSRNEMVPGKGPGLVARNRIYREPDRPSALRLSRLGG